MGNSGVTYDMLEIKEILDKAYVDDIITNVTYVTIL